MSMLQFFIGFVFDDVFIPFHVDTKAPYPEIVIMGSDLACALGISQRHMRRLLKYLNSRDEMTRKEIFTTSLHGTSRTWVLTPAGVATFCWHVVTNATREQWCNAAQKFWGMSDELELQARAARFASRYLEMKAKVDAKAAA